MQRFGQVLPAPACTIFFDLTRSRLRGRWAGTLALRARRLVWDAGSSSQTSGLGRWLFEPDVWFGTLALRARRLVWDAGSSSQTSGGFPFPWAPAPCFHPVMQ